MPVILCSIEGCDNAKAVRGMCHKHYARWQRNGDPLVTKNPYGTPEERFWRHVDKRYPEECWEWTAFRSPKGYGRISLRHGVFCASHRFAYELAYGPIPEGKLVMHKCDNPPCCNPAHLRAGTAQENTQDMMDKGRGNWVAPKGADSPTAKLTEAQARDIKFSTEPGVTLAQRHNISTATVSAIRKGRLWAHLE